MGAIAVLDHYVEQPGFQLSEGCFLALLNALGCETGNFLKF